MVLMDWFFRRRNDVAAFVCLTRVDSWRSAHYPSMLLSDAGEHLPTKTRNQMLDPDFLIDMPMKHFRITSINQGNGY
jgi:hypothetical protein